MYHPCASYRCATFMVPYVSCISAIHMCHTDVSYTCTISSVSCVSHTCAICVVSLVSCAMSHMLRKTNDHHLDANHQTLAPKNLYAQSSRLFVIYQTPYCGQHLGAHPRCVHSACIPLDYRHHECKPLACCPPH